VTHDPRLAVHGDDRAALEQRLQHGLYLVERHADLLCQATSVDGRKFTEARTERSDERSVSRPVARVCVRATTVRIIRVTLGSRIARRAIPFRRYRLASQQTNERLTMRQQPLDAKAAVVPVRDLARHQPIPTVGASLEPRAETAHAVECTEEASRVVTVVHVGAGQEIPPEQAVLWQIVCARVGGALRGARFFSRPPWFA
jgi:hypothetical protein